MNTTILCKTIECKNWFNCGSNYCAAGKTIVKKTKKETLYLCKEFEKKGRQKALGAKSKGRDSPKVFETQGLRTAQKKKTTRRS